jgi:hypothetical protein
MLKGLRIAAPTALTPPALPVNATTMSKECRDCHNQGVEGLGGAGPHRVWGGMVFVSTYSNTASVVPLTT